MGMAGGAYQGDMERARLALQARQAANQHNAQMAQLQMQERRLQEDARRADLADARANRSLDIQEQNAQLRFDQQNAMLEERMRQNDILNADRSRGLDIREQLAAARQQVADARLAKLAGQNGIFGQFQQVCDAETKQANAKKSQGQATMASMMKMGMLKGGTVPMAALELANRQFGFDGKTQAIGAAGFMSGGDFFIDFLQKDPNTGATTRNTQVMKAEQVGKVMYSQAGIFDNADRAAWREQMLKGGRYSEAEVNTMCGLDATAIERLDDAGRERLKAGYADPASDADWKAQYTRRKQEISLQLAERKLAKQLGQNGLTPAQKYALYHFNDFAQPTSHEATAEDVANGLAKKEGDQVWTQTSPDQAFKAAVDFYNKNAASADPATNPAEGGETPVVKEAPAPNAEGQPTETPAEGQPEDATAEGGEETPTDTPEMPEAPEAPEGTPAPTEGGQGEFDFGGGEEETPTDAPAEGGEAPVEGGEGAPAEGGGEGAAPAGGEGGEGGAGAPPPPAQSSEPPPEPDTMAGAAGGEPGESGGEEAAEDDTDKNPFAKWVKRGKKRSK